MSFEAGLGRLADRPLYRNKGVQRRANLEVKHKVLKPLKLSLEEMLSATVESTKKSKIDDINEQ